MSICYIIISFIVGLLLGVIGTCVYKCKIKEFNFRKFLGNFIECIQKLWYIIILITFTTYIIRKYPECTKFTFFSEFDGDNLVFILYLVLLLLPLFDKLELFGINLGLRWQNQVSEQAAHDAIKNILNESELKELSLKKGGKDNE